MKAYLLRRPGRRDWEPVGPDIYRRIIRGLRRKRPAADVEGLAVLAMDVAEPAPNVVPGKPLAWAGVPVPDAPHCPVCSVRMNESPVTPGGWRCPNCGHYES